MARRGKIIDKYEDTILGRKVSFVIRMWRFDKRTEFQIEELTTHTKVDNNNVDEARKQMRVELEKIFATKNWKKFVIVEVTARVPERDLDEQDIVTDREAGVMLDWSDVWLGQFADGTPCYRRDERSLPDEGIPRALDPKCSSTWSERHKYYAAIEATPENIAALKQLRGGLIHLGQKLQELLAKDKIQKTLQHVGKALPMLTEGTKP